MQPADSSGESAGEGPNEPVVSAPLRWGLILVRVLALVGLLVWGVLLRIFLHIGWPHGAEILQMLSLALPTAVYLFCFLSTFAFMRRRTVEIGVVVVVVGMPEEIAISYLSGYVGTISGIVLACFVALWAIATRLRLRTR